MVEVKLTGKSMEERLADRLKNSGDAKHADIVTKHGEGPTRAFHNIFHDANTGQQGEVNPGEGDINGNKRGVV